MGLGRSEGGGGGRNEKGVNYGAIGSEVLEIYKLVSRILLR